MRRSVRYLLLAVTGVGICAAVGMILQRTGVLELEYAWSIGIYKGGSCLDLTSHPEARNPVLTASDVTDTEADIVADPFMFMDSTGFFMFFEVHRWSNAPGMIGLATSRNGITWSYKGIVLRETFHLSYPYVFRWQNEHYLIPESSQDSSIRLYRAVRFPSEWRLEGVLLRGESYTDPSLLRFGERWWMFCSSRRSADLHLFYASDLKGAWVEHGMSPVVRNDLRFARPGGRVLFDGQRILRFSQDCSNSYGRQVYAFVINDLTPDTYRDSLLAGHPILQAGTSGWNSAGMHHVDPHQLADGSWIACVDGKARTLNWRSPW